MKALEILDSLIQRVFLFDRWRRPGKPGEVVNSLRPEDRAELTNLTSDEAKEQVTPGPAYWCDNHYHQIEADKKLSEEKKKFDTKMKFWMM